MSTWHKPKWSSPAYELPNLRHLTVYSDALMGRGDVTVFVPDDYESMTELPLVVLLHGVYSSHWGWALNGGAHVVAKRLMAEGTIPPCIIAMPSDGLWGDGSGYIEHERDFASWIVRDVPECLIDELPCIGRRAPRYLCGLSMGGLGALRLGSQYGFLWSGISAHSSVTTYEDLQRIVPDLLGFEQGYEDPMEYIFAHRHELPKLRFDCGTDDPYMEANRLLHQRLEDEGIPHLYEEFPGGHNWDYWHEHLADSLRFFFQG